MNEFILISNYFENVKMNWSFYWKDKIWWMEFNFQYDIIYFIIINLMN